MAAERNICIAQNIETHAFEITTTHKVDPDFIEYKPYTISFKSPCALSLTIEEGAGSLYVAPRGEIGGYGFLDLDLEQALFVFEALYLVVAAEQAVKEEPSDTFKALQRMGTNIGGVPQ